MIGTLCMTAFVAVLTGAGAAIGELLLGRRPDEGPLRNGIHVSKQSLGLGLSFLIGTAVLGAFLYLPIAVTGSISHAFFAAGFLFCLALTGWHLWTQRRSMQLGQVLSGNWLADLPWWARSVLLIVFAAAAWTAVSTRPTGFDGRAIYAMKARLLYDSGTVQSEDFQDVDRMHFNAHYPLLLPLLEAEAFWLQGSISDIQLRLISFAYILALASIVAHQLRRYASRAVVAWATGLLMCVPIVIQTTEGAGLTTSVDLPMACYVTAGSFAVMEWLRRPSPQQSALAGLIFGAAALTKSEGMLWIAAAGAGLLIVLAFHRSQLNRTTLRSGLAGALALGIMLALQIAVSGKIPFSPYLRSYSAALNWDWLRQLGARPMEVATFGSADCLRLSVWNLTWPCIAAIMLLRRKQPATSEIWFIRLLVGIVAAAFFAVFVVTPYHVYWQIATALHRLVLQLLPLAWVLAVEQLSASGWIEEFQDVWKATTRDSKAVENTIIEQPSTAHLPLRRAG